MAKETRQLRETADLSGATVDESLPVVRRVKILGWESKNRRQYLRESVQAEDYSEKVINLNHPIGPNAQRRVEDRFGWFESVTKDDSGIWGDLHFNPKHPYAEQFGWLAKNKPSLVGLSHDAVGTGHTKDGVFVVEKVLEVKSVDLVADPATTKGLFESQMEPDIQAGADEKSYEQQIGELIVAICKDESDDPKTKRKKVLKALKLFDEPEGEEEEPVEEAEEEGSEEAEDEAEGGGEEEEGAEVKKKAEESIQTLAKKYPGVKQLVETVDRLQAESALQKKHALAHRLCEESRLPSVLVTEVFLAQLIEAKDESAMKKLIEDRRAVSRIQSPRSTGPAGHGGKLDNKSFAQALTK